jgi:DNA-directed DNA polymerase III PolC
MFLNCKTYFSFRYGVLSSEALVKEAMSYGVQALALTNINCTADHWDFYTACNEENIKPILGAEIRNEDELLYIILAKSMDGLQALNSFLSEHLQAKKHFPLKCPIDNSQLTIHVIYPLDKAEHCSDQHEWLGILPSEVNKLYSQKHLIPKCVMRQPVTFKDKAQYNLHRLLRAIDKNIVLSMQKPFEIASTTETFMPVSDLFKAFQLYPQIITNTLQLTDTCNYDINLPADKNKKYYTASPEGDRVLLEKLATEGMYNRFGHDNAEAHQRVRKELKIINQLGFNAYFLITWDLIRYAQNRGFYYVGRGSGANSIVAFCLEITDVNPIDLDLYFERFLNPYRTSPPDFDIDFSWKDRDEVIDYVFKRYGKEHVALLGMYSTFKRRAAIRELGKVFGLPKSEIDALCRGERATFTEDNIQKKILFFGTMMKGFPNHLSIHPGGMLISEDPITRYTAVEMPPKGFATTQVDMFIAEEIGLYKLDILSQRGLGHIKEAIQLIKKNRGINVDISHKENLRQDPKVAAQIRNANTIGCFYIESPAMRQLLKKLKCDDYLTLVAASSIIRPGVAQSGMMRQYIYYYHHPEEVKYIHPKMEELLKETYGVMVYQEDVIKVAHHFAGLDMGEADILRRAMSGKYRGGGGFERVRDKFFNNCKEKGYPDNIANEVWRQIKSFGGYSFSKAHSASFAVESYQSLYLKTYFPMEFMVAVINNFGGFYSTELYFHELKRAGAKLHPPSINKSEELTLIDGDEVFMGFTHIRSLESAAVETLLAERRSNGPYLSLEDFIERTRLGIEQLTLLIRANAFKFTGKSKKTLLWEAHFMQKKMLTVTSAISLFSLAVKQFNIPHFEDEPFEEVIDEVELLGFPLSNGFDLVDADLSKFVPSCDFHLHLGKVIDVIGYYITAKPVTTIKGDDMYFGTFLDSNGEWVDSVHFPNVAEKYDLQGNGFYHITGKVVADFGVYSLEVVVMKKVGLKNVDK